MRMEQYRIFMVKMLLQRINPKFIFSKSMTRIILKINISIAINFETMRWFYHFNCYTIVHYCGIGVGNFPDEKLLVKKGNILGLVTQWGY